VGKTKAKTTTPKAANPLDKSYPIAPVHINASEHLWNAFEHCETEISAGWIVRFFQQASEGRWRSFTRTEIDTFYRGNRLSLGGGDNFTFNRLLSSCHAASDFVVFAGGQAIMGRTGGAKRLSGEPDGGFITVDSDGKKFTPTHEFVSRCYGASPAKD
jgi:hypothetical protein